MAYLGGIVLLLILYVALVGPSPLISFPAGSGMGVRIAMLVSAAWFGLSALPVLINRSRSSGRSHTEDDAEVGEGMSSAEPGRDRAGMEVEPDEAVSHSVERKESILTSYKLLWRTLLQLHHFQPRAVVPARRRRLQGRPGRGLHLRRHHRPEHLRLLVG